ncbi:acyl-CoA carboxylase subunit epsilon [Streptomyces sp. H27-D2]|uniref:acyl-CoA carboxylase subunit epsilon n=1 Tax=Streptomyces sp. H27-D2 TaxID=3046304 RepID=UPI002DB7DE95|nr:acyl-CoA carboxylase subunit epsilon [Streptomyces sp. H27-D2]MEC4017537.1 acyl-CoA carboxylase subunit epsilon [Streptomyces sp. H27-D2]
MADAAAGAAFRVVKGDPDLQELVALTTVLHALSQWPAQSPEVARDLATWCRDRTGPHQPAGSWRGTR